MVRARPRTRGAGQRAGERAQKLEGQNRPLQRAVEHGRRPEGSHRAGGRQRAVLQGYERGLLSVQRLSRKRYGYGERHGEDDADNLLRRF